MLARNFVKLLEPVSIVRVPSWSGMTIIDQYRSPTIYQLGSTWIRQPRSSFSTSTVSWKKKTPKERDPIPEPHNTHRLPLEETLPADDGEPRPNSVGMSLLLFVGVVCFWCLLEIYAVVEAVRISSSVSNL